MSNLKKKIILFYPKTGYVSTNLPYSILAVASLLHFEYEVKLIDSFFENNYLKLVKENFKDVLLVGISAMTGYQVTDGIEFAKVVRKYHPEIKIVWGGVHPTLIPEQTVNSQYVDTVVRGQGEYTILDIARNLEENKSLDQIKGISYKTKGEIISTPCRAFENRNNFPSLPYELLPVEKYIKERESVCFIGKRTLNYITSQGCPFACSFCAEIYDRKWSGIKPEKVIEDIEMLVKKYNLDGLIFHDSLFFLGEERTIKICQGILNKKLEISWGALGRAPQLAKYSKDTWKLIRDSGCKRINIGSESGSPETLEAINKEASVEDTIKSLELCKKYKVMAVVSFILGLPGINLETDFKATLQLSKLVYKINFKNHIFFFIYTPYPGSLCYKEALKCGLRQPQSLEEWGKWIPNTTPTPWVSNKYLKKINYIFLTLFPFLYNHTREKRFKQRKWIYRVGFNFLRSIISWRIKYSFFYFPFEAHLREFWLQIKKNLRVK